MRRSWWSAAPLVFAFVGGVGLTVQSFVNGRFSGRIGSPEATSMVNGMVALTGVVLVGLASGALRRSNAAMPGGLRSFRYRWWQVIGCSSGVFYVAVAAVAAPEVGVALLTVAIVSGQVIGSLAVDRAGLSSAGAHRLSRYRVLGALLAIAAVIAGAIGTPGHLRLHLLALAMLAGALFAVQQAAVSQMARTTGEPVTAAALNLAVGTFVITAFTLLRTGPVPPHGWDAPLHYFLIGGLIGVFMSSTIAAVVRHVGVLRFGLSMLAGQSIAALAFDLEAPPSGKHVTLVTVACVAVAFAAVVISGRGGSIGSRRTPSVNDDGSDAHQGTRPPPETQHPAGPGF